MKTPDNCSDTNSLPIMQDVNVSGCFPCCLLISRLRFSRRGSSFRQILSPLSPTSTLPRRVWAIRHAIFPLATYIRRSPGQSDYWQSQTFSLTLLTHSLHIFALSAISPCSASHSAGLALISEHCFLSLHTVLLSLPSHCRLLSSVVITVGISTAFPLITRLFMSSLSGIQK